MGRRLQESGRTRIAGNRNEWRHLGDTSNTRTRNQQYHPATIDVQQGQAVNQWGVSCINTYWTTMRNSSSHAYTLSCPSKEEALALQRTIGFSFHFTFVRHSGCTLFFCTGLQHGPSSKMKTSTGMTNLYCYGYIGEEFSGISYTSPELTVYMSGAHCRQDGSLRSPIQSALFWF